MSEKVKVKVTSSKWGGPELVGSVITIPAALKNDFVKYGYGEIVKLDPADVITPESKSETKRKPRIKE